MATVLHTLEKDVVEQVLADNPEFVTSLAEISARHGLPPIHIALISNYLQKDLAPDMPAGAKKFATMCDLVQQGFFTIEEKEGNLLLVKNELPSLAPPPQRSRFHKAALTLAGGLAAAVLVAAIFLVFYFLKTT